MKEYFQFKALKTTYQKEWIGALTTFSAMAYILVVQPGLMQQIGLPFGPVMTATILITAFSTFLMAILGKIPVAVAPALGITAYFTFSIVQKNGFSVGEGFFMILIASSALLILNFLGLRRKILEEIPEELTIGIISGIGLFLTVVGLKQIGLIQAGSHGWITLKKIDPAIFFLSLFALFLIFLFRKLKIEAAFILSVLITWGLSIILGYATLINVVALPPSIKPILFLPTPPSEWSILFFKSTLSIFLVTLFDSSAGLITLRKQLSHPDRRFSLQKALYPDAVGSLIGSLIGSSSLAIHLESLAGIHSGSKTGFTALMISLLFLSCLFFYPLASSIPTFASAPCLIAIGLLMAEELKNLKNIPLMRRFVPILIAAIMPLSLSLYLGFKVGFLLSGLLSLIGPKIFPRSKLIFLFFALFTIESVLESIFNF